MTKVKQENTDRPLFLKSVPENEGIEIILKRSGDRDRIFGCDQAEVLKNGKMLFSIRFREEENHRPGVNGYVEFRDFQGEPITIYGNDPDWLFVGLIQSFDESCQTPAEFAYNFRKLFEKTGFKEFLSFDIGDGLLAAADNTLDLSHTNEMIRKFCGKGKRTVKAVYFFMETPLDTSLFDICTLTRGFISDIETEKFLYVWERPPAPGTDPWCKAVVLF